MRGAGTHSVTWDGKNQSGTQSAPGVYFCRMVKNGQDTEVKRIVIQKLQH
jgi:flagellar hook assembly protein FlgD